MRLEIHDGFNRTFSRLWFRCVLGLRESSNVCFMVINLHALGDHNCSKPEKKLKITLLTERGADGKPEEILSYIPKEQLRMFALEYQVDRQVKIKR